MIVDFHTHILPGIDDGCRNTKESISLIVEEGKQGVDTIVLTPHFYAEKATVEGFLKSRGQSFSHLQQRICEQNMEGRIPELLTGAEICYFPGMGESSQIEQLTIDGTRVCLVEAPFRQWDAKLVRDLQQLRQKQELTIILAHLERYLPFQKDKGPYNEVIGSPVYVQCNCGPLRSLMRRGSVLKLFKSGTASILGSDCHDPVSRPAIIRQGREIIKQKLGSEVLDRIDRTGEKLLTR